MDNANLIAVLDPVIRRLKQLDLAAADKVRETLSREFPLTGDLGKRLRDLAEHGLTKGWLCDRQAGDARFSRVARAAEASGWSIDAVLLAGTGPAHVHTKGEVDICLNWGGEPTFCGHAPGWAAFEPGSRHAPTVEGGTMMIFYLLPEGAIEWVK